MADSNTYSNYDLSLTYRGEPDPREYRKTLKQRQVDRLKDKIYDRIQVLKAAREQKELIKALKRIKPRGVNTEQLEEMYGICEHNSNR